MLRLPFVAWWWQHYAVGVSQREDGAKGEELAGVLGCRFAFQHTAETTLQGFNDDAC